LAKLAIRRALDYIFVMTVTMNISLPELLRDHVQQRVAEGGFANASDFVRTLIREDRERQDKARLEAMLMEGVRSGEAEEADGAYWDRLKDEIREAAAKTSER
jgi:antitoxin ParD1/3/4